MPTKDRTSWGGLIVAALRPLPHSVYEPTSSTECVGVTIHETLTSILSLRERRTRQRQVRVKLTPVDLFMRRLPALPYNSYD